MEERTALLQTEPIVIVVGELHAGGGVAEYQ